MPQWRGEFAMRMELGVTAAAYMTQERQELSVAASLSRDKMTK
jgi:hypothetical protein